MTTELDEILKKRSKANPKVLQSAFEQNNISPEEKKNEKLNSKSNKQFQK